MRRALLATVVVNGVLTLGLIAWVTWIVAEPRYWFEDAYSEQGPPGDKGPRGPVGPSGGPGPVGPDAEDAIFTLESALSDLDSRVMDIEDATSATELQAEVDELRSAIDELCSAISLNYIYSSNTAIEELLNDLNNACP